MADESENDDMSAESGAVSPGFVPAPTKRIVIFTILSVLLTVGAIWAVFLLEHLLILLLLSVFVSFAIEPAVNSLARRGMRRGAATGLVFLIVIAGSGLMTWVLGGMVINEIISFVERLPDLLIRSSEFMNDRFNTNINPENLIQELTRADSPIRDFAGSFASAALDITGSVVGVTFDLLTVGLFSFYFTAEGPKVRETVCSFFPSRQQKMVLEGWEIAIDKTAGFLYSRLLLAGLSAILTAIFLTVLGVPYTVALAIWMGITSQFIPTVGTYLGGSVVVLVAFLVSPIRGLVALAFVVAYQQIENYIVAPRITAKTMNLHPAVAFGSVIAGVLLMGPIGAFIALPAAAVLQAFGSTYLRRHEVIDAAVSPEESPG
ncbi:MAG: AI-2E family transporter [Acidobacteria bacterium]|nr:MAG: AI-2E family transporter [Acidobacteriota bacterium]